MLRVSSKLCSRESAVTGLGSPVTDSPVTDSKAWGMVHPSPTTKGCAERSLLKC